VEQILERGGAHVCIIVASTQPTTFWSNAGTIRGSDLQSFERTGDTFVGAIK